MKHPTMLYRSPGPHALEAGPCDYVIVDATEVDAKLAEGWHRKPDEAVRADRERAAAQLQANEQEQAQIAAQLQAAGAGGADNGDQAPAGAPAALKAVHKGRGVWAVVDAAGAEVATGLTREEAQARAGA